MADKEFIDIDIDMKLDEALKYSTYRLFEISKILKKHPGTDILVNDLLIMAIQITGIVGSLDDIGLGCSSHVDTLSDKQHIDILAQINEVEI